MNRLKSGLALVAGIALIFVVMGLWQAAYGWLEPDAFSPDLGLQSLFIVSLIVVFLVVDLVLRRYPARARAFLVGFGGAVPVLLALAEADGVVTCAVNTSSPPWTATWWRECPGGGGWVSPFGIVSIALLVIGSIVAYRDVHRTAAVRLASA